MIAFDQTFWVGVSFVIFMILLLKIFGKSITGGLDARGQKIQAELDAALELKEEAQKLLATYENRKNEIAEEAKRIISFANEEAERINERAKLELEEAVNKRMEMTMQKISSYEHGIIRDIHHHTIDVIMESVREILQDHMDKKSASAVIKQSIEEMQKKLK